MIIYGKPGHVSENLDFNSYSKIDPSDGDYTGNFSKHNNFDNYMSSFDKDNSLISPKQSFSYKCIEFCLMLHSQF